MGTAMVMNFQYIGKPDITDIANRFIIELLAE